MITEVIVGCLIAAYTVVVLMVGYSMSPALDPQLDACAREANVYACEYVPQPISPTLLPPPEGEDK